MRQAAGVSARVSLKDMQKGPAAAPQAASPIQPGHDWGGRMNPFSWYDRYPPVKASPAPPAEPKAAASAWPTEAHYHFPTAAPVGGGSGSGH